MIRKGLNCDIKHEIEKHGIEPVIHLIKLMDEQYWNVHIDSKVQNKNCLLMLSCKPQS